MNVRFIQIAVDARDRHLFALDDEGRVWMKYWPYHEEWVLLPSPEPSS